MSNSRPAGLMFDMLSRASTLRRHLFQSPRRAGSRWAAGGGVKCVGKLQQERTARGAGGRQRAGPGPAGASRSGAGGVGVGTFSLIHDSCSSVWNLFLASSPASLSPVLAGGCLSL